MCAAIVVGCSSRITAADFMDVIVTLLLTPVLGGCSRTRGCVAGLCIYEATDLFPMCSERSLFILKDM